MPDPSESVERRIENLLEAHEPDGRQCACGWVNGGEDSEHVFWSEHVRAALIEALGLLEQFAVSSGDRRQFEAFDCLEDAERGVATALGNNRRWLESHDELPLWARDPRVERRFFTPWEPR